MDCVKIGDLVDGRFRIKRIIGAGSFAWVFVAHDLHSGQTVALKMLRPERFGDEDALRRFESRELRLLERIETSGHSPHVVRILDKRILRHEGLPFLVLEYIAGPDLKEWLVEHKNLDVYEVARIGAGLARGLSVIHAVGGVHRDLKPSNVRMRNGHTPVLVDLGIARALWETQILTQGIAPLTPRYAAPEQRQGLPATPSADVYALGVCLHEMLAGQNKVPARLAKLVATCMAHERHERPSMQDIVEVLDGVAHARSSRPSLWPLVFLSGCSVFPGEPLRDGAMQQAVACPPLAGVVRNKLHRDATSTDMTLEWSALNSRGDMRDSVRVNLPNVDSSTRMILDNGADGHYEIWGWFGETCRHFAVQACEDRAFVQERESCPLPRPFAAAQGDVNGDGWDDIVGYRQLPASRDKPISLPGTTWLRQPDGTSRIIQDAFDLSPVNAYHLELVRRTGDIDRDGCADLVVATYPNGGACSSSIYVLFGDCQGHFALSEDVAIVPLPVNRPDIGDVDEDGFLDLVTGPDDDGDPGQSFLLRGNGHGFGVAEEVIDAFPDIESGRDQAGWGAVLLEDVNGDGHLDVLMNVLKAPPGGGKSEYVQWIHVGRGDGTFTKTRSLIDSDLEAHGSMVFLPMRGR